MPVLNANGKPVTKEYILGPHKIEIPFSRMELAGGMWLEIAVCMTCRKQVPFQARTSEFQTIPQCPNCNTSSLSVPPGKPTKTLYAPAAFNLLWLCASESERTLRKEIDDLKTRITKLEERNDHGKSEE